MYSSRLVPVLQWQIHRHAGPSTRALVQHNPAAEGLDRAVRDEKADTVARVRARSLGGEERPPELLAD
jgi:hypothetical protein